MPVLGIDLGTSNTCAAVVKGGAVQIILDETGHSTMPSVMSLNREGRFFVGHLAKAQMATQPYLSVHSSKRLLGQKFSSDNVQKTLPYISYSVVADPDGMPLCEIGGQRISPVEVSAAVLKKVKRMSEYALGCEVKQAVISVPAHFDNVQRTATKEAAELAGLEVLRLINEPTAAALAYGFGSEKNQRVAVYDFGGGTFDVSVLEISEGLFNVIGTGGDTFLGGNDFNQILADWLIKNFKSEHGIDLSLDQMAMQRIVDAAEYAKIQLSQNEHTEIKLPRISPNINENLGISEVVYRSHFENLCLPLVERSLRICERVLRDAGLRIKDLDELIMVGGMTRMPLIREMVQKWLSKPLNTSMNPDEVVGIGAAIQAMSLATPQSDLLLLDITPLTLGIEAANSVFVPLIPKNTKVPHRVHRHFTTNRDNQSSVVISVYQGEGKRCEENTFLGAFELSGIRPAPRMIPKIKVSFKIDVNGILEVSAIDEDSKESQSIEIVDMAKKALHSLNQ
ncbi:MAG: Hsp70 family protein [Bradymonadales bacterium]|jgi:molecular chaperone DnaK